MISYIVYIIFKIIMLIIFVGCLLSFIPIFDTRKEPLATFNKVFKSILKILPPIIIAGRINISPIFIIILLCILERLILSLLGIFGL